MNLSSSYINFNFINPMRVCIYIVLFLSFKQIKALPAVS